MSNRPPDDDFGFDDDDFDFDDDLDSGGSDEDLGFGDEDFSFDNGDEEFDFDADNEFDFGGDDDITFEEEERRGPSRTFIMIAGLMIGLFVIALVVLVFLALPKGPTPIELTSTAIANLNGTTIALGNETATQSVLLSMQQTADANLTATELARPTETPTPSPTPSPSATPPLDQTEAAAIAMQTQAALDLTATADALAAQPTVPPTIALNAVAQTATALALILQPTVGGQTIATPTVEGQGPAALPTALPDTGLFDDLAAGNQASLGGLVLAIMALLGVIVVSRRLRIANR